MPRTASVTIPQENITSLILVIRGKKVMIDQDLARLYAVSTRIINQSVKRNMKRFPADFMFRLTKNEKEKVITTCDHLQNLKFSSYLPFVFTEQGVAMLSTVLNSERAIEVNIQIMRTFIELREMVASNDLIRQRIEDLERRFQKHDGQIHVIFDAIKKLLEPTPAPSKRSIGFHA